MTTNGEPVSTTLNSMQTNADLRKLVAEQSNAISEIAKERDDAIEIRDRLLKLAERYDAIAVHLASSLRTSRLICFLLMGAFLFSFFSLLGVLCK